MHITIASLLGVFLHRQAFLDINFTYFALSCHLSDSTLPQCHDLARLDTVPATPTAWLACFPTSTIITVDCDSVHVDYLCNHHHRPRRPPASRARSSVYLVCPLSPAPASCSRVSRHRLSPGRGVLEKARQAWVLLPGSDADKDVAVILGTGGEGGGGQRTRYVFGQAKPEVH